MDNLLRQLKQLSEDIVPRLSAATMDEMLDFIQSREEIIEQLKQKQLHKPVSLNCMSSQNGKGSDSTSASWEYSPSHQHIVEEICRCDEPIMARMLELKQEAAEGLAKFDQSRMQKNAYEAAYSMESAFIDQRK